MLSVKNLIKQYNKIVAVNDISFDVREGKIFGLLGPNGAGKTTAIRTILNIIKPSSGSIQFDGKPITEEFFNTIGYLPEERGLYKKSKVIDVIKYFAVLKNLSAKKAASLADEWLKRLSITDLKWKKIEELSKGNQQKIQFIIAVLHEPKLLILDEPFAGFDPINQEAIKEVVLSFVDQGKIIILSTHQMDTAEKLCSDILLMNNGKEVCSGPLNEIKQQFGLNVVHIEFSGDVSSIKNHPAVLDAHLYNNTADIKLKENVLQHEFLRSISQHFNINTFSIVNPSLHQIFIDVIQRNTEVR
ncbi:MAG: ATP-binding cassette domain-containing protein [Ignavibacteriaceae bacterium]|nr:ATP-binding cassette domain-containing protein [Ignavibacteriaceae bacterium]